MAGNLKSVLRVNRATLVPGVYDGFTARLAASAGFELVYMTGAGVAAAHGYPDFGLVTLDEMRMSAAIIARASQRPVIADADTGFGNALNVVRTVHEYESAGVSALHIEDQVFPKRCGHMSGKEIVPREEFLGKIATAAHVRSDADFAIIARTDARAVAGMDEAVSRANAALDAGADMAFVEAVETLDEMALVPAAVRGPCVLNIVPGGRTPIVSFEQASAMGYRLVLHPGACLFPVMTALEDELSRLRESRASYAPRQRQPGALFDLMGAAEWDALRASAEDMA